MIIWTAIYLLVFSNIGIVATGVCETYAYTSDPELCVLYRAYLAQFLALARRTPKRIVLQALGCSITASSFTRDDYREVAEITLLQLEAQPQRGARIMRPVVAYHHARWMPKVGRAMYSGNVIKTHYLRILLLTSAWALVDLTDNLRLFRLNRLVRLVRSGWFD